MRQPFFHVLLGAARRCAGQAADTPALAGGWPCARRFFCGGRRLVTPRVTHLHHGLLLLAMSKPAALTPDETAALSSVFAERLSLSGAKAKDVLKKPDAARLLAHIAGEAPAGPVDPKVASLLVTAATSPLKLADAQRSYIASRALDGSLKSNDQVNAAAAFLQGKPEDNVDRTAFDEAAGVGAFSLFFIHKCMR